jgi:hypothetical protein
MSWHYLQGQEEAFWEGNCLDGAPCALSRLIPTAEKSYCKDNGTECLTDSQSGMTSAPLTENNGGDKSTLSAEDSPAKTFQQQEKGPELLASVLDYGSKWHVLSVKFNPLTSWWKTHRCLFPEDLTLYSLTLPRWGSMRNGELSGHVTPERPTEGKESGFWATPAASDGKRGGTITPNMSGQSLPQMVNTPIHWPVGGKTTRQIYPTPTAQDAKNNGAPSQQERNTKPLNAEIGGALNPDWVEWLMGWPIKWSQIENEKEKIQSGIKRGATKVCCDNMPNVRIDKECSKTPHGQEQGEQHGGEYPNTVSNLSQECTHGGRGLGEWIEFIDGGEVCDMWEVVCSEALSIIQKEYIVWFHAMSGGEWSPECIKEMGEVSRVSKKALNRVDRLEAIGNGQVPAVVKLAWKTLIGVE